MHRRGYPRTNTCMVTYALKGSAYPAIASWPVIYATPKVCALSVCTAHCSFDGDGDSH